MSDSVTDPKYITFSCTSLTFRIVAKELSINRHYASPNLNDKWKRNYSRTLTISHARTCEVMTIPRLLSQRSRAGMRFNLNQNYKHFDSCTGMYYIDFALKFWWFTAGKGRFTVRQINSTWHIFETVLVEIQSAMREGPWTGDPSFCRPWWMSRGCQSTLLHLQYSNASSAVGWLE